MNLYKVKNNRLKITNHSQVNSFIQLNKLAIVLLIFLNNINMFLSQEKLQKMQLRY
jgi:hypothetical protein